MSSEGGGLHRSPLFLVAGFFASLAWFMYAPIPFLGAAVVGAVFCFAIARTTKREWTQFGSISIGTLLLTFAVAESYWWTRAKAVPTHLAYPPSYLVPNRELGYMPRPGAVARMRRTAGEKLVFDVTYTIDSLGMRMPPPTQLPQPRDCLVFFGDSYTIGEGVPDSASMPFRVGIRTGGRFQVRNFGVHGYGAHQMLALLQSGSAKRRIDCNVTRVIYQAIPAHVARASGRARGVRGPRYVLDATGAPVRSGNLEDADAVPITGPRYVRAQFDKSALVALIGARDRAEDHELFRKLVQHSARISDSLFPGSEFHVLVWAYAGDNRFLDDVKSLGVRFHPLLEVLPALADANTYRIAGDGHPNARAHDAIAEYVAKAIVDRHGASAQAR